MRSCSWSVLVQETAEQVASVYPDWRVAPDEGHSSGWIRRFQPERSVPTMAVVESSRGAVPVFRPARFPGPHPRTRRARLHAPGSPRAPSWTVALAFGSAVPSPCSHTIGTPVFTGDSCPANPPRLARCAPSPCDRLSRPPTTTGTPPRPATSSRRRACPPPQGGEGGHGSLPTFTTTRSTSAVPSYAPAASPGVRRSPSPWPPHRPLPAGVNDGRKPVFKRRRQPAPESLAATATGVRC
jgi:hypothetical protein